MDFICCAIRDGFRKSSHIYIYIYNIIWKVLRDVNFVWSPWQLWNLYPWNVIGKSLTCFSWRAQCTSMTTSDHINGYITGYVWLHQWLHLTKSMATFDYINNYIWLHQWLHDLVEASHTFKYLFCTTGVLLDYICWIIWAQAPILVSVSVI